MADHMAHWLLRLLGAKQLSFTLGAAIAVFCAMPQSCQGQLRNQGRQRGAPVSAALFASCAEGVASPAFSTAMTATSRLTAWHKLCDAISLAHLETIDPHVSYCEVQTRQGRQSLEAHMQRRCWMRPAALAARGRHPEPWTPLHQHMALLRCNWLVAVKSSQAARQGSGWVSTPELAAPLACPTAASRHHRVTCCLCTYSSDSGMV